MSFLEGSGIDCDLDQNDIVGTINARPSTYHMSKLHVRVSFNSIAHVLDIILQQGMCQNHLDLVCGEESSGACMSTVPKSQAALVHADKLVVRRLLN